MANFATIRVTKISKAMQITAIRTVANSLPENEVILLTFLISGRYIPYTDLIKIPNRHDDRFGIFHHSLPDKCRDAIGQTSGLRAETHRLTQQTAATISVQSCHNEPSNSRFSHAQTHHALCQNSHRRCAAL